MVEDPLSAGEPGPQTPGAFPRALEPVLEPAAAKEPPADVVRTPRWIYATLETPGLSRETLEVAAAGTLATIRGSDADGRTRFWEIDLGEPAGAGAIRAAYRNGVLGFTIPRRAIRPRDPQGGTRDGR